MNMKKQKKFYIRLSLMCLLGCALLVGGGYAYLRRSFRPAEGQASKIPYSFSLPDNKGILFDIAGNRAFVYLDFTDEKVSVIIPQTDNFDPTDFGYSGDFKISGDMSLLAAIIDYSGGITLTDNGEDVRYTGVQIADIMSRSTESEKQLRTIIPAVMKSIAENGLEDEAYNYIIDKADTDLTVPDVLMWRNYISKLCKNGGIIN